MNENRHVGQCRNVYVRFSLSALRGCPTTVVSALQMRQSVEKLKVEVEVREPLVSVQVEFKLSRVPVSLCRLGWQRLNVR